MSIEEHEEKPQIPLYDEMDVWSQWVADKASGSEEAFVPFTGKQKQIWDFQKLEKTAMLLAVGTVRSGKSYPIGISALNYMFNQSPVGSTHLIIGPSKETLRGVFYWLFLLHARHTQTTQPKWADGSFEYEGRHYRFVGGTDKDSGDHIRGLTVHSMIVEEATAIHPEFFAMALSRLSYAHSKCWVNCNPAGTRHWLLTDYIQPGGFDVLLQMSFEDNAGLSEDVKDRIRDNLKLRGGSTYQRLGLGRWADSDEVVMPIRYVLTEKAAAGIDFLDVGKPLLYGLDYGRRDPTVLTRIGRLDVPDRGLYDCIDAGIYDCPVQQLSPHYVALPSSVIPTSATSKQILAIIDEMKKDDIKNRPGRIEIMTDPSAVELFKIEQKFMLSRSERHRFSSDVLTILRRMAFIKAENDRELGINALYSAFASGRMTIHPDATLLLDELAGYEYDPEKEDDKSTIGDDHHIDSLRYAYVRLHQKSSGGISAPLQNRRIQHATQKRKKDRIF